MSDPLAITLRQIIEGKTEITTEEIERALGYSSRPDADTQRRIIFEIRNNGFRRIELRTGAQRFIWRRPEARPVH